MKEKKSVLVQIITGLFIFLTWAGAIFAVVVIIIPGLLWLFNGRDIKPVDDSFLQLSVVNLPDSENGFYDLEKVYGAINTKGFSYEKELVSDFLDSDKWGKDSVAKLLEDNKEALGYFDAAANKTGFQMPYTDDPAKISRNMPVVPLNAWREVSRLSGVKAIYLAREKQYKEALDEAMKPVIVGNAIENSQSTMIAHLVGIAMKNNGLDILQKVISMMPEDSPYLSEYGEKLSAYRAKGNKSPFSIEYMICKEALSRENLEKGLGDQVDRLASMNGFYFKRNMTVGYCFDNYKKLSIEAEKDCKDVQEVPDSRSIYEEPNMLKWYFTENLVGKKIVGSSLVAFNSVIEKKCDAEEKLQKIVSKINKQYDN